MMAKILWDHVVHYVNDLDYPIEIFQKNGLIAFKGGSHKQWGTFNALSYFDLTYIEFLGIEDRELAETITDPNDVVRDSIATLPDHEALSRVALRTDNIEAVAANLEAAGLNISPIMAGKRLDNQGQLIEWKMLTIAGSFQGLVYPFVIQWKGTDDERYQNLVNTKVIQSHPAGKTFIAEAVFTVNNPVEAAKHWQSLFGLSLKSTTETIASLSIGDKTFTFQKGPDNQFTDLVFKTENNSLQEKTLIIGEGKYKFQAL
ncbi:VOC family protein [Niallia sp. 01092]|uniref:VOC family protein n=1 Tax=unclassified Niallia TaxID=2837522 RepID=UPI003FD03B49